jgi:hypothetical protein
VSVVMLPFSAMFEADICWAEASLISITMQCDAMRCDPQEIIVGTKGSLLKALRLLVGESKLSRESKIVAFRNFYFYFVCNHHQKFKTIIATLDISIYEIHPKWSAVDPPPNWNIFATNPFRLRLERLFNGSARTQKRL